MRSRETVDAFIAQVVSNDHVGAIRDWYLEDAWMQENQAPPRQGGSAREIDGAGSRDAGAYGWRHQRIGRPANHRWRPRSHSLAFHVHAEGGGQFSMEEVAWQTWRGDKIATEAFFYDPAQRGR